MSSILSWGGVWQLTASPEAQAGEFKMGVGVVESGHESPSDEVDDAGAITLGRQHFFHRTHGGNLVAGHRRGLGDRVLRVNG